jgi:phenylpropionate dioxygenase-like ring-hydroxylating dioxygenase large terminal subunit
MKVPGFLLIFLHISNAWKPFPLSVTGLVGNLIMEMRKRAAEPKPPKFLNNWNCVGIKSKIDFSKPYAINIGELPLVFWKSEDGKIASAINICKHMGSKLDNGIITHNGCLKCQYHGLENSYEDRFGEVMEHDGKIFWAYKPVNKRPFSVPFYTNPNYETSHLEITMDASLTDSAFNTMDLRHPEFVHNKLVGFGNSLPPESIKTHYYPQADRVGLSFDYLSNPVMRSMNDNVKITKNFHMFIYPTFSWSKVTFNDKNLIIGVNLLPLSTKKTRWYITICHNYYTSIAGKEFMKLLASVILGQDFDQMRNQHREDELKKAMLFDYKFADEDVIMELREMFKHYKYPTVKECVDLYNDSKDSSVGL